jgi:tyrosine-protein kinase Etk/Wzc
MSDTPNASGSDDDEISLLDLVQVVAENLRLLVIGPLAAGLAALAIAFTITPTFTATITFLPPQQQQSAAAAMLQNLGALSGLAGAASGIKNPADQYIAFLKSRRVADTLIERFALDARYQSKAPEDARKALAASTRITSGKDGLISIEFDDRQPQFAADIANAYVEELGKLMNLLAVTEAQQRRAFFERQLKQSKDQMVQAELTLRSSGLNQDMFKNMPQMAVESVARLQAQVTAQEVRLGAMRGYLTENAPDFRQGQAELAALKAQLSRLESDQQPTGKGVGDYIARYRDFKYHETLFELFARQFELAKVDESREGAVIQVLDRASPPDYKSKPKRALIAVITSLAAAFALLLFVFVRQAFRNAALDPEASQKLLLIRRAVGFRG